MMSIAPFFVDDEYKYSIMATLLAMGHIPVGNLKEDSFFLSHPKMATMFS